METKIIQIGNSCGIRIPAKELKNLKKTKGDKINIKILSDGEARKKEVCVGNSQMSPELASIIIHDSDTGDSGFSLFEAQGFLKMGSRNVKRLIGEGLVHKWLIRQTRGREVFYDASLSGKSEAYCVLGVTSESMKSVTICHTCKTPFNNIRNSNCPVCELAAKEKQRLKDLKATEDDFISDLRGHLSIHKQKPDGNPVLAENTLPKVIDDGNLTKGIIIPQRKSVPTCVVERHTVDGETIPRADSLNKGYYEAKDLERKNRELIAAFKTFLLSHCPPQQHDEYKAICEIIFMNDCKLAGQEFWGERAATQIRKNSKILPGLRYKDEKVGYLKYEAVKVAEDFIKFQEEAAKEANTERAD